MHKRLQSLYYGLPRNTAYAGASALLSSTRKNYTKKKVLDWLQGQDAYNLHKPVRRRFPRRHYAVSNIDDVWEVDLMDVKSIKSYNNDFTYLLTVIDVISKYAWVEPLKNKSAKCIVSGFEKIFAKSKNRYPVCIQSDKGREFVNRELDIFLKNKNILYRVVRSPDVKGAIVERLIRTIKERIYRYFTHNNTRRYLDVLPNIVEAYNQTKHSATKMTPASVTLYNAAQARKNIQLRYEQSSVRKTVKYKVGDLVRVSRARNVFEKAYESGWTLELFKIARISSTHYPTVYHLKDLANEEIDGFFYEEELSRVNKDVKKVFFEVDAVLKTRTVGRAKEHFVSWKGYPDKFNSWIKTSELKKFKK